MLLGIARAGLAGYDRRSRCHLRRSFSLLQYGKSFQPAIHSVERVSMKSYAENIFEKDQQQAVGGIQNHADEKCPLLSFAREMPEENEHAGDNAVDDKVEYDPRAADRMRDGIDDLRDAESNNEVQVSASQSDDGINQ